jgi:hypothetical protein
MLLLSLIFLNKFDFARALAKRLIVACFFICYVQLLFKIWAAIFGPIHTYKKRSVLYDHLFYLPNYFNIRL